MECEQWSYQRCSSFIYWIFRFRWVYCQLETLRRCFPAVIRRTLDELPETLDETYERTLLGIEKEKRKFTHRIFQCLIAAVRPLHIDGLAGIFAIRFDTREHPQYHVDWRSENSRDAVLSACSSLIAVVNVDGSPVVQFSHFSVQEFLISGRLSKSRVKLSHFHVSLKSAHTTLAKASLSILLSLGSGVDKDCIEGIPFSRYAAQHWTEHSRFEDVSSSVESAMERLFNQDGPSFATWIWIYDIDRPFCDQMLDARPPPIETPPLYYATLCGFYRLAKHLIASHPGDVHITGGYHDSSLNAALAKGNIEIAMLLLQSGANVDTMNEVGNTALHEAAQIGRPRTVRLLLEHHANIDILSRDGWTPLMLASCEGKIEIMELLIQSGAAVDSSNNEGWKPLLLASRYGHLKIVKLLIQSGGAVDSSDNEGWAPLLSASTLGHLEIAQLLIQSDAIVDSRDNEGWIPLFAASRYGHLEIVQLLIQSNAAVDSPTNKGWTPLFAASRYGHLETVQLLVQSGAAVDSSDNEGWAPLLSTSALGHLEIAQLLIYSADTERRSCGLSEQRRLDPILCGVKIRAPRDREVADTERRSCRLSGQRRLDPIVFSVGIWTPRDRAAAER